MARPKSNPKRHRYDDRQEFRAISIIDDLDQFERFREELLPALRKDIQSGMSAQEIQKKYAAIVQARVVTTALLDKDSARAMTAAKDILDRTLGKPTEKKEIRHQFSELKDEELDAILVSELEDLVDDETES